MKQAEITGLSVADLCEKLAEEKKAISKLKLSHAVSPIENPMKIRATRKGIARLLTQLKASEAANK